MLIGKQVGLGLAEGTEKKGRRLNQRIARIRGLNWSIWNANRSNKRIHNNIRNRSINLDNKNDKKNLLHQWQKEKYFHENEHLWKKNTVLVDRFITL